MQTTVRRVGYGDRWKIPLEGEVRKAHVTNPKEVNAWLNQPVGFKIENSLLALKFHFKTKDSNNEINPANSLFGNKTEI